MTDKKRIHTHEELKNIYASLKYPTEYFEKFESKYHECYTEWYKEMKNYEEDDFEEGESIGNNALEYSTLSYIKRFVDEKEKGHSDEWTHIVANSFEDDEERIIDESYSVIKSIDEELAKQELHLHCKSLCRDELFEKHYLFLFEIGEGLNHPQEIAKKYSEIYKQQIAKGKTPVYSHQYADLMSSNEYVEIYCEKYAFAYDKAISEGKSKMYAELFADKYGDGSANHGERENRDIPDFWEEKVFAYMNGWEYATNNNFSNKFIGIYENIYLNTIYADEPEKIPWNRLEEYILEEALKKYNLI